MKFPLKETFNDTLANLKNPFMELKTNSMSIVEINIKSTKLKYLFDDTLTSKSDFVKMIGDDNLKVLTEQMKLESEYLKRKQNDLNFLGLNELFN